MIQKIEKNPDSEVNSLFKGVIDIHAEAASVISQIVSE